MLYNEEIINVYGYNSLESALLNNKPINLGTTDANEARYANSFEHYLVRMRLIPSSRKNINDAVNAKLERLLSSFEKNPTLVSVSYILGNEDVALGVFKDSNQRNRYLNAVDKLKNAWRPIYENIIAGKTVSESDKHIMYAYLIYRLSFNKNLSEEDRKVNECAKNLAIKILQKNKMPTNKSELMFIFKYASKFTLSQSGYPNEKVSIKSVELSSSHGFIGGYERDGYIAINNKLSNITRPVNFFNSLDTVLQTVCHETTHMIQELQMCKNPDSIHGLEMSIFRLASVSEYHTGYNYRFMEIEENAQLNGYTSAMLLYMMAGNDKVYKKLFAEKHTYHDERQFQYEYVTYSENGQEKKTYKEDYNVEAIRDVIKKNPSVIKKHPALRHLFNPSGSPRSLEDILTSEFESHDINKMYEDTILYEVRHGAMSSIDRNKLTNIQKHNMYKKLCSALYYESNYIYSMLRDNGAGKYGPEVRKALFNKRLSVIIQICKFINSDLKWMQAYETKLQRAGKSTTGLYGHYSSYVRSLLNNLESHNLGELKPLVDKHKQVLKDTDDAVRNAYVDRIIAEYSKEELDMPIITDHGRVTLRDFISSDVRMNMDREHYMRDNFDRVVMGPNNSYLSPSNFVKKRIAFSKDYDEFLDRNKSTIWSILPNLDEVKTINENYKYTPNGEIIDSKNGMTISAPARVKFALSWQLAASVYNVSNTDYAYNEPAKNLFIRLCYIIAKLYEGNEPVDKETIYAIIPDNMYKYTRDIIERILDNDILRTSFLQIFEENYGLTSGTRGGRH